MKKSMLLIWGCILVAVSVLALSTCLNPVEFNPAIPSLPGDINFTDVTSAVFMLTNRSKTVDVTNVTITQPEWAASGNSTAQPPSISFAHKPKRLEKKAQYLTPSDKSYQVVINYTYDAYGDKPAGNGTQTLIVPLPLPKQIVEYIIYRNEQGVVIIDKEAINPDPNDTGNPAIDPLPGEGSSPAVIPPEYRDKMATFVVVSKTSSQIIESVNFKMGSTADYTMGRIGVNDKQSIALRQGSWETRLAYTRDGSTKTLGPLNSIVVPSNDPQAIQEHYLYFYLNKRGDYAISPIWPPFPNDAEEEDMLPLDNGYGRGLIKIINNSQAIAEMVTLRNQRDTSKFPWTIDYIDFSPPIPIQYNRTGYVNVVGTPNFPIEGHEGYLIQVTMVSNNINTIIERRAYIKDQVVTIVIETNDLQIDNSRGARFTLENKTSAWPVQITGMTIRNKVNPYQSSYYGGATWIPMRDIDAGGTAVQYVMSSIAMPILPGGEFEAIIRMYGNGVSASIDKIITPNDVLYSESSPDQNTRTIEITDADVPQEIKDGDIYARGAAVTIQNNIISWPVKITGMMVRNKADTIKNTYYDSNLWSPIGMINQGGQAVQRVMSSPAMPITNAAQFEAVIFLLCNGNAGQVIKPFTPEELYSTNPPDQNIRTIDVIDNDVPDSIKTSTPPPAGTVGTEVTLKNRTSAWPVEIIGMTVQNKITKSQKTIYNANTWSSGAEILKNGDAIQLVLSSTAMPITAGETFEAVILLRGNNKTAEVTKDFSPAALYSTDPPDQNTRIITITDSNVPANLQTPDTDPTDPDIGGAANGDTIVIDGIEWIKVRTYTRDPKLVLLMLKGVTGPCVPYNDNRMILEYGSSPSIKGYVDTWYAALNAPTLKKIAYTVNVGTTPNQSWPGNLAGATKYNMVAFIPRLSDINYNYLVKANTHRYWISDINQHPTTLCWWNGIIRENGDSAIYGAPANASTVFVRPCIWVTAK